MAGGAMNVLAVIHHEVAPTGVFADEIRRHGHELHEWVPSDGPPARPPVEYDAILAFGGGMQVDQEDRFPWIRVALDVLRKALERDVPTLGICLGGQMLARAAGGTVGPAPEAECGWGAVELTDAGADDPLLGALPRTFEVFQWHSYSFSLPPGGVPLARNDVCLQGFRAGARAWGLQWHPEVTADSIDLWASRYVPAPGGVPAPVDVAALRSAITNRIEATNDDGRALCARFLAIAQAR